MANEGKSTIIGRSCVPPLTNSFYISSTNLKQTTKFILTAKFQKQVSIKFYHDTENLKNRRQTTSIQINRLDLRCKQTQLFSMDYFEE